MSRNGSFERPVQTEWLEVFFDGGCPLCCREMAWLRTQVDPDRIKFVDIAAAEFEAIRYGKTLGQLMARMHARDANGRWIVGCDVFRQLYAAAGFGVLVSLSRWPVIRQALDVAYAIFARYRVRLGRRCHRAVGGTCKAS